ncbi:MAG: hypothetical protein D3910_25285 [Candidatus Electrothrix sp. ATG2]|nr:hypothetical protein [Candidatus Electrothrix sp. ATG2]
MAALVIEGFRVAGARYLKKRDDLIYKSSVYQAHDFFYWEFYNGDDKKIVLPPCWYFSTDGKDPWKLIDQSELPNPLEYPLVEILSSFVNSDGMLVSVDQSGNWQEGGWFPA